MERIATRWDFRWYLIADKAEGFVTRTYALYETAYNADGKPISHSAVPAHRDDFDSQARAAEAIKEASSKPALDPETLEPIP